MAVKAKTRTGNPGPTVLNSATEKEMERRVRERLEDKIRERAYALYEEGGRVDGHALDHWLAAEAELRRKSAPASAA